MELRRRQNCRRQNALLRFGLGVALGIALGIAICMWLAVSGSSLFAQAASASSSPAGAASAAVKQLGSIREIHGSRLLLVTDQGEELSVQVQPGARLLRLAPGQTDLKNATTIQLSDLQVGDRALVRGTFGVDGKVLDAVSVLIMKQQDIAHRMQEEMLDWQRRGVGGLVQQVDAQSGVVTLSVAGVSRTGEAGGKALVVRATPKTSYRRYAPNSMKWEDATPAQFGEIRVGDQLRARGSRSEDGRQLEAEEMVFGSFRNIAGLITSVDAAQGTLTLGDLATKKPVTVQITADSKMRKLPAQLAERLAMRLRGDGASAADQEGSPKEGRSEASLSQMLGRLLAASLTEFQKGDAVMIVSTAASEGRLPQAIIVLGGAEPILRANPSGRSAEGLLTPWSLASAPSGEQP